MTSSLKFSVAQAVTGTTAPPIPIARQWAADYNASSPQLPLLDLSQGVPGDPPHPSVLEELAKTAADPASARYGPILGEPDLREAMAKEYSNKYGVSGGDVNGIKAEDIGITTGCNMAFLVLLMALCPPGESSALIPLPAYFNHSMSLSLQSIKPLYIPCDPEQGFKPSLETARKYLESAKKGGEGEKVKPKMIVLTTPNNPTGATYSPEELKKWYDLAKEYELALVLDETYRDFVEGAPHDLFTLPDWRSTLVSLGSFSKGYRIPGHRLGSIIASSDLLHHIATICDCMQICPPRPPQLALQPLIPSLTKDLDSASSQLKSRHQIFRETISSVPGWEVISSGGFYAYVSFPVHYTTASSSLGLKRRRIGSEVVGKSLALRCGVLTIPGEFFVPKAELEELEGREAETLKEDRWLRFAIANVNDEAVRQLGPRLQKMNQIMGMEEEED